MGWIFGDGYGATTWPDLGPGINFVATEDWTDTALGSRIGFYTIQNGTNIEVEAMRIDQSGNVGIGMESPGQKLSVAGTIESTSGGIKFPDGTIQTTAGASGTFLKGGTGRVGYAWANNPSSSSYTPSTLYSFNSSGGGTTITRSATGVYQVTFTGLGSNGTEGGHVQVTSYGSGNSHCKVRSWDSTGADFVVNVRCFDGGAGAAADSQYDVQVIW